MVEYVKDKYYSENSNHLHFLVLFESIVIKSKSLALHDQDVMPEFK